MEYVFTHAQQAMLCCFKFVFVTSNHEGQSTILGSGNATRHWSINKVNTDFLSLSCKVFGSNWRNSACIQYIGALFSICKDSIGPFQDFFNNLGVWNTCDDIIYLKIIKYYSQSLYIDVSYIFKHIW